MGLKEIQEELKTKIAEAEKAEAPVEEVAQEQPKEEVEQPKEEPKAEEKAAEVVEEPKKNPAEYAKERREAKAAKLAEELAAANARIAELTKPKEEAPKPVVDPEPNKTDDPQAWNEWKLRQTETVLQKTQQDLSKVVEITEADQKRRNAERLRQDAEREIQGYQSKARQIVPDIDVATQYYANVIAASLKIVNPRLSDETLARMTTDRMVLRAAELYNEGHENPVLAMYEEVKTLGYKKQEASNDEGKEIKPDLAKVAANRARNAGTAAAQGDSGRGDLTPKVAATLTNAEFAKLKPEEKKRLFQQLQQAG